MGAWIESFPETAVEEVTTAAALDALHPEWAGLWARCLAATPFQSPDWLVPFWRHLGQGELCVLTLRHTGRLVGLAPLFISNVPPSGEQRVLFIGTPITDYSDVLIDPMFEEQGTAAILSYLVSQSGRWDCLDFQQLRPDSPLLKIEATPGLKGLVTVQEVCPALQLPDDVRKLTNSVPLRMLDNLQYYRRRLASRGPLDIEKVRLDNFSELFDRFLELQGARWQSRGQAGVLSDPRLQEFHRESAQHFLISGSLRLYGLRSNGRLVATLYGFVHGRQAYHYLTGFDPEMHSFSPATVMLGYAIEEAIAEGCLTFDFLRGREPYKFMWGAKARLNYRRQFRSAV